MSLMNHRCDSACTAVWPVWESQPDLAPRPGLCPSGSGKWTRECQATPGNWGDSSRETLPAPPSTRRSGLTSILCCSSQSFPADLGRRNEVTGRERCSTGLATWASAPNTWISSLLGPCSALGALRRPSPSPRCPDQGTMLREEPWLGNSGTPQQSQDQMASSPLPPSGSRRGQGCRRLRMPGGQTHACAGRQGRSWAV